MQRSRFAEAEERELKVVERIGGGGDEINLSRRWRESRRSWRESQVMESICRGGEESRRRWRESRRRWRASASLRFAEVQRKSASQFSDGERNGYLIFGLKIWIKIKTRFK